MENRGCSRGSGGRDRRGARELRSVLVIRWVSSKFRRARSYPFLWFRQAAAGEAEGRKSRPTAVALRLARAEGDALVLLPITTQPPAKGRKAVEVPETEKQRAGLDMALRCWIMLDEFNTDVIGKSYYLEPVRPLGMFSRAFFAPVARLFVANIKAARKVDRR